MKTSLKKHKYGRFLNRARSRRIAEAKAFGLPTREEAYAMRMSPIKTSNSPEWSETYAKTKLESWGFPYLQEIDGNPTYIDLKKKHQKSNKLPYMLTPDFVVGNHMINANDPDDFYVDVHEITDGYWGDFDDDNNKFSVGNPIKAMYKEMYENEGLYTSDNPYRLLLNETDPNLRSSLYTNIKKKSDKYCTKRGGSTTKFGMVSVMSNKNHNISMVVYTKVILSIFDDILIPFFSANYPSALLSLRESKRELSIPTGVGSLEAILAPFEGNWTFWLLVGSGPLKNKDLLLVNSANLNNLDRHSDLYKWLNAACRKEL